MYSKQVFGIFSFFLIFLLFTNSTNGEEPDVNIDSIKYTNDFENGDPITIVSSGKDNATVYNYNFYDDDDDIPQDWYAMDFDDTEWNSSAGPFGNDELDGVNPGTIWQTENGENDYIVIRHYFTYEGNDETLSATLKLAYNNYYTAYLNGNLIRSCGWGCGESDAEYWNHELTYDGSSESGPNPEWLIIGENVLAIRGTDSTWGGGDGEQWLDVELVENVQAWKENPIVLGDNLVLGIDFFNNEESNVTDLNVTLEIEGTEFANLTIEIENNKTFEWRVDWTPDRLGEFNVTAKVLNESLTRFIHVGYYAYNFSVDEDYLIGNTSELLTYNITISNEGDVDDNYTFQIFGTFTEWDVEFVPNVINLAPGEMGTVQLKITPDNETYSGVYGLTLSALSQYHGEVENIIVQSGRDNETEWKWINSTGDRLYEEDNTTWTEIDFVPNSNWTLSPAPFGDSDLSGIDYNTEWTGNNYAYFRHIFYIDDPSDYENDTLSLNMAANNYGTYYLNGEEIFDDLGWGQGHYAEYWNEEIKFNASVLKVGKNVLASVVRETGQTQWFDEELISVTPKSSAWGFQPEYLSLKLEVLPVYNFELVAPISDKPVSQDEACCEEEWNYKFEIWIYNKGNIEDSYEINVTLNDTANFTIVDYESVVYADFAYEGTINLTIALNTSVTEFSVGEFNISVASMNSTTLDIKHITVKARMYVIADILPPGTFATSASLVNNTSFQISWEIEDWYQNNEIMGNDTKYIIIEYSSDNGTFGQNWSEWKILGNYSVDEEYALFTEGKDGHKYRFRSVGGDDDNQIENKENKYDCETLVDVSAPYAQIELGLEGNLTNLKYFAIDWSVTDYDIEGYEIQYRFLTSEENWSLWTSLNDGVLQKSKWIGFNVPFNSENQSYNDGIYQFRVISYDDAGNRGVSESSRKITIDTKAPNTRIANHPNLTDAAQIEIDLEALEDTVNFTLYYSIVDDLPEVSHGEWIKYEGCQINIDCTLDDLPISITLKNKSHYYFKIIAYDEVGNFENRDIYTEVIVDRERPNSIKNLKLTDNKMIVNNTIDVVVSFVQPTLQDSDDILEYRVYRSTKENETGKLIGTVEYGDLYLFYRDNGVEMGEIYYYSVSTVDRIGFESDLETDYIDLTIETETTVVVDEENDEVSLPLYLGIGGLLLAISGAAGYYFLGRGTTEIMGDVVADAVDQTPNFTEMDGDLLCNECGGMFIKPLPDEIVTCPSCGNLDEK